MDAESTAKAGGSHTKRKPRHRGKKRPRHADPAGTIVLDAVTADGKLMQDGQNYDDESSYMQGWARSVETLLKSQVEKRTASPRDGHRPQVPETRLNAPGPNWHGVMVMDCGYVKMTPREQREWQQHKQQHEFDPAIIRTDIAVWLIGRDEWGRSVCIWVHHCVPYFYVGISDPNPHLDREAVDEYARQLHGYLQATADGPSTGRICGSDILQVRPVKRSWFYGYKPDAKQDSRAPRWNLDQEDHSKQPWTGSTTQASDWYLRVSLSAPFHVNKVRRWCSSWVRQQPTWRVPVVATTSTVALPVDLSVFEANVEFVLRVMVDWGLVGCGWCAIDTEASADQGLLAASVSGDRRRSRCDIEYVVDGGLFEEAMLARDNALERSLTDTEASWDAVRHSLWERRKAGIRFVARESEYQRYTDGMHAEQDPHEAWFNDLREATAPLNVASFDIECCNRQGTFPDPLDPASQVVNFAARVYRLDRVEAYERARAEYEKDPDSSTTSSVGCDVSRSKHPPPFDAVVAGIGEREPMHGGGMDGYPVTSISCAREAELFAVFAKLMVTWSPDVIEGYNSVAFDMAYMLRRAEAVLKVEKVVWDIGKLPGRLATPKNETFGNKASGQREMWRAHIHGAAQLDLYRQVESDIALKLRSYTLNNVAYHLLGENKLDMDYKLIPEHHFGTPKTRQKLDAYCDADAALPFKIERAQSYLMRCIEMARVTGVPLNFLLTKGQQVLVYAQLLRKAKERGFAIPWIPVVEPERDSTAARNIKAYEGAWVLDPKAGFYPITTRGITAVLDFAALYPSEMRAENLGYTTVVTDPAAAAQCRREHARRREAHDRAKHDDPEHDRFIDYEQHARDYEREGGWKIAPVGAVDSPANPVFVRGDVRKSLLVSILEALTAARGRAKAAMKKHPKGSAPYKKEDARQMALKVCNNSVYGFTGAVVGRLPCLLISAATTAYGRASLRFVVRLVNELLEGDNEVIYGDTDSVMVLMKDLATGERPEPGTPYSALALANIKRAYERGAHLGEEVNRRLVRPMELELEKLFIKYLLLKKKKYAAEVWMNARSAYGVDAKGIEMVRRDNPLIVGLACARFVDILMGIGPKDPESGQRVSLYPDIELAKEFVSEVHRRILNAEGLPMDAYVITQRYSKPLDKYKNKPAHITLAQRMLRRDAGSAPKLGDRVPYVIMKERHTEAVQAQVSTAQKVNERSEDPKWAEAHGMAVDSEYYAQEKFMPPMLRILAPVEAAAELANAPPKDPGMATRQRNRYYRQPEKYDEWVERKRQEQAERIVYKRVFERNYQSRKRQKCVTAHTAIGRFLLKKPTVPAPAESFPSHIDDNDDDDDDSDSDSEEEVEIDEDAKERLKGVLDDMYNVAVERLTAKRSAAAPSRPGVSMGNPGSSNSLPKDAVVSDGCGGRQRTLTYFVKMKTVGNK